MKTLKERIFEYHIGKKYLVYTKKNGRIIYRTTISMSNDFKKEKLYSDIVNATKFLPSDTDIIYRIKAICISLKSIPLCPICNKRHLSINVCSRSDDDFFNKTCGAFECQAICRKNGIKMTKEIKQKHSASMLKHKKHLLDLYNKFLTFYRSKTKNSISETKLISFCKNKIDLQVKNGQIIKDSDFDINKEYLAAILLATNFIKIPNIITTKQDFKWQERLYCVINKIHEQQLCKFCKCEPVKFLSLKNGYKKACAKCVGDTYREKIGFPTLTEIKAAIDLNKYEIIQFPKSTEVEQLIIRCKKCGTITKHFLYNGKGKHINELKLCSVCDKYTSILEQQLFEFIKTANINYDILKNNRDIIDPYELDIVIPDKKIAFEFDGFYWHNSNVKNVGYHKFKTDLCEKQGIQLIHVFEDEWLYKQDIVKSRIKNLLGIFDKITYARNCKISEIDRVEAKMFLEENHIQGSCNSKVSLGLYYDNELISLMTFGKCRFDKKHEWELLRFCNRLGYHIPGAAGKLLKYFERNYNPKSLVSYADRRWSKGKLYKALGFTLDHISRPDYWYYKNSDYHLQSRILFQKHKLKKLLENFDEKLSEAKNMENNGYFKIYDCGNLVFVKHY